MKEAEELHRSEISDHAPVIVSLVAEGWKGGEGSWEEWDAQGRYERCGMDEKSDWEMEGVGGMEGSEREVRRQKESSGQIKHTQ